MYLIMKLCCISFNGMPAGLIACIYGHTQIGLLFFWQYIFLTMQWYLTNEQKMQKKEMILHDHIGKQVE